MEVTINGHFAPAAPRFGAVYFTVIVIRSLITTG